MKINIQYLDRFKETRHTYLYPVSRGVYLSFYKPTLEYIGVEVCYSHGNYVKMQQQADDLISKLLARDILETTL